jgi:hypothetical protein
MIPVIAHGNLLFLNKETSTFLNEIIRTAGLAGGLLCPYKGLVLAAPDGALNGLPTA